MICCRFAAFCINLIWCPFAALCINDASSAVRPGCAADTATATKEIERLKKYKKFLQNRRHFTALGLNFGPFCCALQRLGVLEIADVLCARTKAKARPQFPDNNNEGSKVEPPKSLERP